MTLCIHIGYHKTATTWLQRQVLVPELGFAPLMTHEEVNRLLIAPQDLGFDPNKAQTVIDERVAQTRKDLTPIISSENLSGHPFFGGRQSAAIAKRVHQAAPDAQIVITIRSQVTMLPSVYMQYLQRGGTLGHEAFFAGTSGIGYPGFETDHFCYDRLIRLYQGLFPAVHVVTYEQLAADPETALRPLCHALGRAPIDLSATRKQAVSPSPSQTAARLLRGVNHLRRSTLNPAPCLPLASEQGWVYRLANRSARCCGPERPIEDYVRRNLAHKFTQSNAELGRRTGGALDLSAYP